MKKIISFFSLSTHVALADWQKMNQDYNDLVYQKVEALANNTDLYDFSEDFESVVKKLTTVDLSIIEDYGCYCNFNSENNDKFREKAKGRPLDDVDRFCKALHDGYTCAQVDSNNDEENDYECTPWEVKYNSAFNNGLYHDLRMDQLSYLCKKANTKNSCAAMACQIEGWFVQSFFTYFANGGALNNLKHSNGFKHKNNCFGTIKPVEELDCCNNFPLRYPFRNKEGTKKCCRSVTYNVLTHQCCEDGSVRMDCNNLYEDDRIEQYIDIFLNSDDESDKKKNQKKLADDKTSENVEDSNEIRINTSTESNESSIPEPILITDLNAIGTESVTATTPVTESSLIKKSNNEDKKKEKLPKMKINRIKSKDLKDYSTENIKTEYGRKVLKTRLEKLGLIDKL